MNRVVITGAGVVSPIGDNFHDFCEGIKKGIKGIREITCFDTRYLPRCLGAEVKADGKAIQLPSNLDRKEYFVKQAMTELFNNNSFIQNVEPEKRYLNLGAGIDYFDLLNYSTSQDAEKGIWNKYSRSSYDIVKELAIKYEVKGGLNVNVTACVASSQAIGLSFRMLKNSDSDKIVITGGFDSMLNHLHYMGFHKLGALSTWEGNPEDACRPFDKNRCGLVLGEGAAVLSMQNDRYVQEDSILAEIIGYCSTMDSYMVTDPHPEGIMLAKAGMNAIKEAGISPDEIDCAHLHETGTYKNALAESRAMQILFPNRYKEIPVFSLKGQVGHLIAACGAVELLGVIYSLVYQQIPPTINFEIPDSEAPLNVIKGEPLCMKIKHILKLNAAFGGQNTAFVVRKYE